MNLRVTGTGVRERKLDFTSLANLHLSEADGPCETRPVRFHAAQNWQRTIVLHRDTVLERTVSGPAILTSYDSTIAVPPGTTASTDGCGSVVMDIETAAVTL